MCSKKVIINVLENIRGFISTRMLYIKQLQTYNQDYDPNTIVGDNTQMVSMVCEQCSHLTEEDKSEYLSGVIRQMPYLQTSNLKYIMETLLKTTEIIDSKLAKLKEKTKHELKVELFRKATDLLDFVNSYDTINLIINELKQFNTEVTNLIDNSDDIHNVYLKAINGLVGSSTIYNIKRNVTTIVGITSAMIESV